MQVKRKVAAGGVVIRRNNEGILESLLVQHKEHKGWGFPKGHLDAGETLEGAALREVEEETGVCGEVVFNLSSTHYTFVNRKGKMIDKIVHWYLMRYLKTGKQTHAHEIEAVAWLPVSEIRERLAFENDRALFDEVEKSIQEFAW